MLKSCNLELGFFDGRAGVCWRSAFLHNQNIFMLILKDLLSPNTISLAELWGQSVFASVDGGPLTFSV